MLESGSGRDSGMSLETNIKLQHTVKAFAAADSAVSPSTSSHHSHRNLSPSNLTAPPASPSVTSIFSAV